MAFTKATKNTKKAARKQKTVTVKKNKKTEEWLDNELKDIVQPEIEEEIEDEEDIDIKDLPIISLSTSNKNKLAQIDVAHKPNPQDKSTVVYLGHLPYGFEEYQMKEFFSQFGEVQRSFISRSPKTGRTRGYAFLEFLHPEIALIVADTMNDYLLFKKRLICRVIPIGSAEKIQWKTEPLTERTPFSAQRRAAARYNSQDKSTVAAKLVSLEKKKKNQLAKRGIDYQFDGYTALINQHNGTDMETDKTKIEAEKVVVAEKRKRETDDAEWEKRKQAKVAAEETKEEKKAKAIAQKKAKAIEKKAKAIAQKKAKAIAQKKEERKAKEIAQKKVANESAQKKTEKSTKKTEKRPKKTQQ